MKMYPQGGTGQLVLAHMIQYLQLHNLYLAFNMAWGKKKKRAWLDLREDPKVHTYEVNFKTLFELRFSNSYSGT